MRTREWSTSSGSSPRHAARAADPPRGGRLSAQSDLERAVPDSAGCLTTQGIVRTLGSERVAAGPSDRAAHRRLECPASTTERGIPYTTHELRDSVSTSAARSPRMAPAPRVPSSPMPVSTTPTTPAPHCSTALSNSTSTEGKWALSEGTSLSQPVKLAVALLEPQVRAAARQHHTPGPELDRRCRPRRTSMADDVVEATRERVGVAGRDVQRGGDRAAESPRGARLSSRVSACGPPVDVPITTSAARAVATRRPVLAARDRHDGRSLRRSTARRTRLRTFSTSSPPSSYRRLVASAVGLLTRSKAPRASAATTSSLSPLGRAHDHHAPSLLGRQRVAARRARRGWASSGRA